MKKINLIILFLLLFINIYPQSNEPIPADFFGLHQHKYLKKDDPWAVVPFKTWRLWDTGICWPTIQPEENKWDFKLVDKAVKASEKYGVELVINIGLCPKWAALNPNLKSGYGEEELTASPPKDIEIWKKYVKTLAERYKGKIRYWEIWNEPDHHYFYKGTIEQMVELVKEAYIILKKTDPNNMIISPCVTGYPALLSWLDKFLSAGGKDYVDIIGTHFYIWFKGDMPEKVLKVIEIINSYKEKHGIMDKPIWDTECGFLMKKIENTEIHIAYIARLAVAHWAYGAKRLIYYSYDNKHIIQMIDKKYKNENHVAKAFRITQDWLIGAILKKYKWYTKDRLIITNLERNGGKAVMIWHTIDNNPDYKIKYRIPDDQQFTSIRTLNGEVIKIPENKEIEVGVVPILLTDDKYIK